MNHMVHLLKEPRDHWEGSDNLRGTHLSDSQCALVMYQTLCYITEVGPYLIFIMIS